MVDPAGAGEGTVTTEDTEMGRSTQREARKRGIKAKHPPMSAIAFSHDARIFDGRSFFSASLCGLRAPSVFSVVTFPFPIRRDVAFWRHRIRLTSCHSCRRAGTPGGIRQGCLHYVPLRRLEALHRPASRAHVDRLRADDAVGLALLEAV